MFNKKQLVVMWSVGAVIVLYCLLPRVGVMYKVLRWYLYDPSWATDRMERLAQSQPFVYANYWLFAFIVPLLIIGSLLVLTLHTKRK